VACDSGSYLRFLRSRSRRFERIPQSTTNLRPRQVRYALLRRISASPMSVCKSIISLLRIAEALLDIQFYVGISNLRVWFYENRRDVSWLRMSFVPTPEPRVGFMGSGARLLPWGKAGGRWQVGFIGGRERERERRARTFETLWWPAAR
jgi:hypothetical protein